jgi:hypothetical protein
MLFLSRRPELLHQFVLVLLNRLLTLARLCDRGLPILNRRRRMLNVRLGLDRSRLLLWLRLRRKRMNLRRRCGYVLLRRWRNRMLLLLRWRRRMLLRWLLLILLILLSLCHAQGKHERCRRNGCE